MNRLRVAFEMHVRRPVGVSIRFRTVNLALELSRFLVVSVHLPIVTLFGALLR